MNESEREIFYNNLKSCPFNTNSELINLLGKNKFNEKKKLKYILKEIFGIKIDEKDEEIYIKRLEEIMKTIQIDFEDEEQIERIIYVIKDDNNRFFLG